MKERTREEGLYGMVLDLSKVLKNTAGLLW